MLHGAIRTAGTRLAAVFRDQDFLATTPAELAAALRLFRSASVDLDRGISESPVDSVPVPPLHVSDDQMIALCEQIFNLSVRLKSIVDDDYLTQITETSLKVLQQRHDKWTTERNVFQSKSSPGESTPARPARGGIPSMPRDALGKFHTRTAEEREVDSATAYADFMSPVAQSVSGTCADVSGHIVSPDDWEFLLLVAGLYPVPVLGGWGAPLVFRSPALRLRAITELQQMDAVFDSMLFDIIERNANYAQKAQLVTLKWREIVPIGRATALWALLSLSETPPADNLRAGWLIQAIAAAQDLKQGVSISYLDTLHPVVENFEQVRGEFPVEFLHQLLSTLVLYTLERSNDPGLLALVQNWRRQYGARVDVDMFACAASGKPLISIQPANPKFSDISQILLDLQTIIGTPSMHLVPSPQKVLTFAAFTPTSPRYSRRGRPGQDSRPGADSVQDVPIRGGALSTKVTRYDRRSNSGSSGPRFMGLVPRGPQDDTRCWYCAGMLKTARQFYVDTADKHAPPSSVPTAEHPFLTCRRFKDAMLLQAKSFLKGSSVPVRMFAAAVDFGELSTDNSAKNLLLIPKVRKMVSL